MWELLAERPVMPRPKRHTDTVKALLQNIAEEASTLPNAPLRALIPHLVQAERELAGELAEVVRMLGPGRYNAQMLRKALVQVRGAMNAIEKIRPEMRDQLANAGRAAGTMATRHLSQELALFSRIYGGTIEAIPLIPASKTASKLLLDRFDAAARNWSVGAKDEIRKTITVGLLKGESVDKMARRIGAKAAGIEGATAEAQGVALASAIGRKQMYRATRVVRTEVLNAYNEHAIDSIRQVAEDDRAIRKRWDAALDYRVCPLCRELHGSIATPGGMFPGGGGHGPPRHPQCRCTVVIWKKGWED